MEQQIGNGNVIKSVQCNSKLFIGKNCCFFPPVWQTQIEDFVIISDRSLSDCKGFEKIPQQIRLEYENNWVFELRNMSTIRDPIMDV